MAMTTMLQMFEAARRVSVPLVGIRTADQAATADDVAKAAGQFPVLQWDAARGMTPYPDNKKAEEVVLKLTPAENPRETQKDRLDRFAAATTEFKDAVGLCARLPRGSVVCFHNAHRQVVSAEPQAVAANVQAVANVRDVLKQDFRMAVLLGPDIQLPPELQHDVALFEHELPGRAELAKLVTELHASANLPTPGDEVVTKAVDALAGLSLFEAEQDTAMSFTDHGLDLEALWRRKVTTIQQTAGLKVYRGRETFADVIGLDNVKEELRQQIGGRRGIGVVVWIDEIDKVFANVEHDTTQVRTDQMKNFLTEMEDNEWEGMLLAGLPGGGKSLVCKAFGNEAGVPTIAIDLGGMESKYVGESEANIRQAIRVIKAIGDGRAYVVATSNNATVMRPELQRRMTSGFYFVDLMTKEERAAAWRYFLTKYELPADQPLPDDTGWTAAEIRNCCRRAWNCKITLERSARFVVPVAQARAAEFDEMRKYAHGRFLDASKPGVYQYLPEPMQQHVRAIALPRQAIDAIVGMKES